MDSRGQRYVVAMLALFASWHTMPIAGAVHAAANVPGPAEDAQAAAALADLRSLADNRASPLVEPVPKRARHD